MTGINAEAVITTHCKCQDIRSSDACRSHVFSHTKRANRLQLSTNGSCNKLIASPWIISPVGSLHFKFWCVWVDWLSGSSGPWLMWTTLCCSFAARFSHLAKQSRERNSLSSCAAFQPTTEGCFKGCTCSSASYIFNEGELLHLSQVNGSSGPLVVKISTEWGKNTRGR